MRYPAWWNKEVTLYHKEEAEKEGEQVTRWEKYWLGGCFAEKRARRISRTTVDTTYGQHILRIPVGRAIKASTGLAEEVVPMVGDIFFIGICTVDLKDGSSAEEVTRLRGSFAAAVVRENVQKNILMPHFYISEDWRYANRG